MNSLLVGAIYKHSDELSFDVGVRDARYDDHSTVDEIRLGLSWALHWKDAKQ